MAAFIIYIIRWGIVLTLLYSLYGLLLKRETLHGVNRVVLLAILVASMVLPLCQIETPKANIVTQGRELLEQQILLEERIVKKEGDYWITDAETEYVSNIDRITNGALAYDKTPLRTKGWNWVNTLLLLIEIYAVGVIVYWLRYFWQLAALLLLIHRGKRIEVEGVPKHVRVIVHPDIKTPSSWMRWIILNPEDVNTRAIINHELAHIRLGHSWDMLLCEFTCRMLWCVPFAWMLRQDLRDVHEYQADRRVLSTGIKDEEYQLILIRKATGTGLQPVVNALNQSPIKRRFKMMYTKPSRRWVALKAAYLLPLSLMALMAFARPQTLGEIEQKVEKTETEIAQVIEESGVIDKVVTLAEDLGMKERETEITAQPTKQETIDSLSSDDYVNNVYRDEYINLSQSPEFPGGISALQAFVQQHVAKTLENDTSVIGKRAYVQFRIKQDGTIDDIGLVRGDREAYHEAVKIVEQMPQWIPARRFGRLADAHFVLTVDFTNN